MTDGADTRLGPDELLAMMPYATALGIELHQTSPTLVTGSLAWKSERCTAGGILHGGAIMSLADTVGAQAVLIWPPSSLLAVRISLVGVKAA